MDTAWSRNMKLRDLLTAKPMVWLAGALTAALVIKLISLLINVTN